VGSSSPGSARIVEALTATVQGVKGAVIGGDERLGRIPQAKDEPPPRVVGFHHSD
jgi:hypothetical protein